MQSLGTLDTNLDAQPAKMQLPCISNTSVDAATALPMLTHLNAHLNTYWLHISGVLALRKGQDAQGGAERTQCGMRRKCLRCWCEQLKQSRRMLRRHALE